MSWSESGPVSTPPRSTVTFVALALAAVAVFGVGYGMHAVWRAGGPAGAGSGDESQDAQAVAAKPLVDIPAVLQPPVATNAAPAANAVAAKEQDTDEDEANTIAAKTAAAQAAQSKPGDQSTDIDQTMTSPTEKPQAPAKPSTDEGAPGSPTNSVPF